MFQGRRMAFIDSKICFVVVTLFASLLLTPADGAPTKKDYGTDDFVERILKRLSSSLETDQTVLENVPQLNSAENDDVLPVQVRHRRGYPSMSLLPIESLRREYEREQRRREKLQRDRQNQEYFKSIG